MVPSFSLVPCARSRAIKAEPKRSNRLQSRLNTQLIGQGALFHRLKNGAFFWWHLPTSSITSAPAKQAVACEYVLPNRLAIPLGIALLIRWLCAVRSAAPKDPKLGDAGTRRAVRRVGGLLG